MGVDSDVAIKSTHWMMIQTELITASTLDESFRRGRAFWSYGHQVPPEAWSFTIKQTIITLLSAFGIFSNFFIIRLSDSQQHKVACQLWSSMTIIVCSSSSLNVCVISLDRSVKQVVLK
ncbi:hypothetical protein Btru_077953 [Bulinus truncatus]|nr:hypothetical protein Btru_077953 [Bulinus truncatus]